jgi:YbbR domain-containing protein
VKNKRYHIILASFVFALLTWVSINLRDEYTVVRHLPVVVENLREEKALKYPIPKNVSVRFRGNGWLLAALYLSPDVKYFIDASSLGPGDFVVTARELMDHVKLPVPLQVLDVKPDSLVLALGEYREKRVIVVPHFALNFRDGYGKVGDMRMNPDSVTVGGSYNIIESISGWPTMYRKFENVRTPIDVEVPLEDPQNYSVDVLQQSVRLRVNVESFAEKTFSDISVTASGTPLNQEIIFVPSKMDVIVRGGIDQLAKISVAEFRATVSYQSILQDTTGSVIPVLTAPEDVKVVSRKPERFRYIIRKKL